MQTYADPFPKLLDKVTHLGAGHRFRLSSCCGRIQRVAATAREPGCAAGGDR